MKTHKRLFSWLIVSAMVLSMVPALGLPAFAAEAASDETVYGAANLAGVSDEIQAQMQAGNSLDDSDEAIDGYITAKTCPMCGAENVEWVHGTGAGPTINKSTETENDGKTYHYYFDSTIAHNNNFVGMFAKDGTVCVALKSTADITCQKYRVMISGSGNTLNIMGTGKLVADQEANASTDGDLGLFQMVGGTLNLYGGKFQHKQFAYNGTPDYRKAVIRVHAASVVVNIFDGVVIGPEEVDQTTIAQNVHYTAAGTVNMFGGTIQNGVSPDWGYSGNVTIAKNGIFNMYGGTIKNGTFKSVTVDGTTSSASTIGGNVMVGGIEKASRESSSDYNLTPGTFNMYGGTIQDGTVNNGGNGGGNVFSNSTSNLLGGTISGGYAKASGGSVQVNGGTTTIGGTLLITGGEAKSNGGSIYVNNSGTTLNIEGGKIIGGKSGNNGGSLYINTAKAVNISGGVIDGGTSTYSGGNIYSKSSTLNITGGTIQNGVAGSYGGNLHCEANITVAGGQFLNGIARKGGGNINLATGMSLTIQDGTIAGGCVTGEWNETEQNYKPGGANWGGNIRVWAGSLEIAGGLIYGGSRGPNKGSHTSNNIGCLASLESTSTASLAGSTLTLSGGVVIGDIGTSSPSQNAAGTATCPGTTVIFKGAPTVVNNYQLADGTTVKATYTTISLGNPANIDELEPEAYIMLSVALDRILTQPSDNAEAVKNCLVPADRRYAALVNENNELYVGIKPYEAPVRPTPELGGDNIPDAAWTEIEKASVIQYQMTQLTASSTTCPMCGAENVTWTNAGTSTFTQTPTEAKHYYVSSGVSNTKYNWIQANSEGVDICIALIGNPTVNLGGLVRAGNNAVNCTINIGGKGTLIGSGANSDDLGLLLVQGSGNTLNLYGGTYIYNGDGHTVKTNQVTGEKDADGKYTIKGSVEFANSAALTVKGGNNTVNIFDGVVIGPETVPTTQTYNVRVEVTTADTTDTINMYGGIIRNGVSGIDNLNGYSIQRYASGNVTLNAQTSAKANVNASAVFNMYGGEIYGGTYKNETANHAGGNIAAVAKGGSFVNIYGGSIEGGKATRDGGSIYIAGSADSQLNMYGGTVSGGYGRNGGNIYSNNAAIYLGQYALVENGYAFIETDGGGGNIRTTGALTTYGVIRNGESRAFAGNLIVEGTANVHNIAGGEIYGGKSDGQGGNVRAWATKVVMTDGKIYDGDQYGSTDKNHNIWLVSSDLTMTGGEIARCEDAGIRVAYYKSSSWSSMEEAAQEARATCTVTLGGDAKVGLISINNKNELHIDNSWTGEATLAALNSTSYTMCDAVESELHICGAEVDGVFTKGGSYEGKLYYEPFYNIEVLGVDGVLTMASVAGIKDNEGNVTWYESNDAAANAYVYGEGWLMPADGEMNLPETLAEVNLQLVGSNVTVNGNAVICGVDSTNDDYSGYGTLIAGEGIEIVMDTTDGDNRYIALEKDGAWSFHRVVIDLTTVTLRTGDKPGMYYKVQYKCDATLAERINSYGVVLSLQDMPYADFDSEAGNAWTKYSGADFLANRSGSTVNSNSGALVNVIKESLSKEENAQRMQMKVYANAYLQVDITGLGNTTYFMSDMENGGMTADEEDFTGVAYSMYDIVKAINDNWDAYSDEDKAVVAESVMTWANWIANAEQFAAELGNIVSYEPPAAA